jgi:hypothetical protein
MVAGIVLAVRLHLNHRRVANRAAASHDVNATTTPTTALVAGVVLAAPATDDQGCALQANAAQR